jgi:ribonuclease-3
MLGVPDYQVEESGPDHQKSFRAAVRVGGRVLGSGQGRTKKEAEQHAAEAAWTAINAESAPPQNDKGDDGDDGGDGQVPGPAGER